MNLFNNQESIPKARKHRKHTTTRNSKEVFENATFMSKSLGRDR